METINNRVFTLIILAGIGLASCGGGGSSDQPADDPTANQQSIPPDTLTIQQSELSWTACGDPLECAVLTVPIDYANPAGNTIDIDLIRHLANPQTRRGALLINPGGPGGSGVGLLKDLIEIDGIPAAILAEFDVVGFDPRGVAGSNAIICSDDSELNDGYLNTREEVEALFTVVSQFASNCFEQYGSYVQFLGSNNVVRDMEEIRKGLQESRLDFLGYSYGTRIAALYLQTYPASSGRMILDGSMTPQPDIVTIISGALQPAQANVSSMLAKCTLIDSSCNADELATLLQTRIDTLETNIDTIPEANIILFLVQLASTIPPLGDVVIEALYPYLTTGDGAKVIELLDLIVAASDGSTAFNFSANIAVLCADDPARPSVDSLTALLPQFNATSDLLAESYISNAAICSGWPESIDPIPVIATGQAPASLVIGGPTDAQTPLQWAEDMAVALGGHFLRSEHEGHTVVFNQTNSCTEAAAANFLREGLLPDVSNCPANPVVTARLQQRQKNAVWLHLRHGMGPAWRGPAWQDYPWQRGIDSKPGLSL